MKYPYLAIFAGCMSMLVCSQANAQSIDYKSFQELFGEPVTTSGNGSPQRQSEVPLNMEIITAEQIARSGARTIPEILRFLPGLSVQQHTMGQTEVSIRGYNQGNAERILVLVNGRQVYTDNFGQVVWDNIPVEIAEIQQIEVVKGPNTALFGFNAVSGVINIITYNPLYNDLGEITFRGGTQGLRESSFVKTVRLDPTVALKVSGGVYEVDDSDEFADFPSATAIPTNKASLAVDLWAQPSDNVQTEFEITKNHHDRNEMIAIRQPSNVQYDATSVRGRVLASTDWGLLEGDVYLNDFEGTYTIAVGGLGAPVALRAKNTTLVARLNDTVNLGKGHIVRVGGEYRKGKNIYLPSDQDYLTYDIWTANALWDWQVNPQWRTSLAVRYDRFNLSPDGDNTSLLLPAGLNPFSASDYYQQREEVSFNAGIVYQPTPLDTFRATVARGADLPSYTEFGLQIAAGPPLMNAFIGDPNIDTSIVTNYELGYDRIVEKIDGQFRAAVFFQQSDDLQGFAARTAGPVFGFTQSFVDNMGDSQMYGAEIGLEGKYKQNWDWFLNYTYVHVDDDLTTTTSPTAYEGANAEHVINAHLGYTAEKWRADVFAQYKSSFDDLVDVPGMANTFTPEEVNDQIIVNASFAYDLTDHLEWSVSASSLTGKTQQVVYGDAEQQVYTSLSYRF